MVIETRPLHQLEENKTTIANTVEGFYDQDWKLMDDDHHTLENAAAGLNALHNRLHLRQRLQEHDHVDHVDCGLDDKTVQGEMFRYRRVTSDVKAIIEEHDCELTFQQDQQFGVSCPSRIEIDRIEDARQRSRERLS